MKSTINILCALALLTTALLPARAASPEYLNYQGLLNGADGQPLPTGNYTIEFNIYDSATLGGKQWGPFLFDGGTGNGHGPLVPVVNGRFNVIIGPRDANSVSITNAFASVNRFVEIKVNGGSPILPLQQFLSTPYAYQANNADLAGLVTDSNVARLNGNQTFSGGNTFSGGLNVFSAVNAGGPAAGSHFFITGNQIQQYNGGAVADMLLNYSGGNVVIGTTVNTGNKLSVGGNGYFSGNVGIGQPNPGVKLDVAGTTKITMADNGYRSGQIGNTVGGSPTWYRESLNSYNAGGGIEIYGMEGGVGLDATLGFRADVSIRASGWIASGMGITVYSDRRIKRDLQASVPAKDLAAIQQLQVTDYRMVDPAEGGMAWRKGFIAQEVETVIPGAVSHSVEFVPDIFSLSTAAIFNATKNTLSVKLAKDHGLKVGDRVRLHMDGSRLDFNVCAVTSTSEFVVDQCERAPEKVFVYGRQVTDFRTVDYDRLFTTGIGAIQELAKRMEKLETRETHLAELEQKAARFATMEQEVAELKKLVAQLAESSKSFKPTALTTPQEQPFVKDASLPGVSTIARANR